MYKKIIQATSLFVLSIIITSVALFSDINSVYASQVDSDADKINSMDIVIEESSHEMDNSKTLPPDLGDDQAFPFIPGFGKNSGKD